MKEKVLKQMELQLKEYRERLVSGKFTAEEIVEQSYQFVVKQSLYYVFENHNTSKLTVDEWEWLYRQEHILDYLYQLWMNNDSDLIEEFALIIHNELNLDMEEHKNE